MVKSADNRLRKYTGKFDATTVAARYTALKDLATTTFGVQSSAYASMEAMIKQLIEPKIDSPLLIPQYLAFARQVKAKTAKYGGLALYNEAVAAKAHWVARGLDSTICADILAALGISTALYGS
jgi:hypothetical protein